MKTNRNYTTLIILSVVLLLSATSFANSAGKLTGDILKRTEKNISSTNERNEPATLADVSVDFSYLRFDVYNYTNENTLVELPASSFDCLYFDVAKYAETAGSEIIELPVAFEFEYLRFDASTYTESAGTEYIETPLSNEFNYLRFDANKYAETENNVLDELPVTE